MKADHRLAPILTLVGLTVCLSASWLPQPKLALASVSQTQRGAPVRSDVEITPIEASELASDLDTEMLADEEDGSEGASAWDSPSATKAESIPGNRVTHRATDFHKGRLENIVVTDGLQLGNEFTPYSREPYQFSGIYFSPVFAVAESFDTLKANWETLSSPNARLIFELCTARAGRMVGVGRGP